MRNTQQMKHLNAPALAQASTPAPAELASAPKHATARTTAATARATAASARTTAATHTSRVAASARTTAATRTSRRSRPFHAARTRVVVTFSIVAALVLSALGFAYAEEVVNPQFSADINWFLDDPYASEYTIYTSSELYGLAQLVNGTAINPNTQERIPAQSFKGVTFLQDESMTLCYLNSSQEWTPIGTEAHPFSGTYDGQGNSLRGLTITQTYEYAGFFGCTSATSTIKNLTITTSTACASKIDLFTIDQHINYVGTLVGYCGGEVTNCTSKAPLTIESYTQITTQGESCVHAVAGLCGQVNGNLTNCSYRGSGANVRVMVYSNSIGDSLRVCDSIGGVVGHYAEPDDHGIIDGCVNGGDIWVSTYGDGGYDSFGVISYPRAYFVGGVAGYSNGSIYNSHNGVYDSLYGYARGSVQTSTLKSLTGTPLENHGGDQVGGVVGSLRGESEQPGRYNDGDPDDPTYVSNCYNMADVVAAVGVGGICGQGGAYTYITQCYNGTAGNEDVGHVVSTRWNKPCTGGILGEGRGTSVNYCANYALIENTQTGYYTAGIVGVLWIADDYPSLRPELYACFNSGHVYTACHEENAGYREAGICGSNEGYVHDCVMLYGTVPYNDNAPIGAITWGLTANLNALSQEEMQSSYCASLLNSANGDDWTVYWYINDYGYPVLNTWESPTEVTELTKDLIASVEILEEAGYLGPDIEPVPTLQIILTNGRILWQNTDFYVVPQEGACDVSGEGKTPYSASIVGLGRFSGRVDDVCKYGIGKGDITGATIAATGGKYSNGKTSYPTEVHLIMGGSELDASAYTYRIYDYATTDLTSTYRQHYVVYDSAGYVSFDGGVTLEPLAEATLAGDYILYDRDKVKISDSDANVYSPQTGQVVTGTYACAYFRSGKPAGYVIEALADTSAYRFTGSVTGLYSFSTASLKDDVAITNIECEGQTWYWEQGSSTLYAKTAEGEIDLDGPRVTFTGKNICPTFTLVYLDKELELGDDYRVVYGDPNNSYGDNISATSDTHLNGFTIRSADSGRFSSYVTAYFTIEPAALEDCDISIENDNYAFTGTWIEPNVTVSLNGVTLKEGRDYEIEYQDNLYSGIASCTVKALNNLSGGEETSITRTFTIGSGIDISNYTVDKIPSTYYNFGQLPKLDLTIHDENGEVLPLVANRDYTLSLSSTSVGDATLTITGAGAYTGTLTQKVTIKPYDASTDIYNQIKVTWQDMTYGLWQPDYKSSSARYNISSSCPVVSVDMYPVVDWGSEENNYELTYAQTPLSTRSSVYSIGNVGAHYYDAQGTEVTYKTAEPGELTATVVFSTYTSNSSYSQPAKTYGCTGSISHTVRLTTPVDIATDVAWYTSGTCTYNGSAFTPVYGINIGSENNLSLGRDYTIEYENNTNVGIASYTIKAIDDSNYVGEYSSTFPIIACDLTTESTVGRIANQDYTGYEITPKPVVYVNGTKLVEGVDYTLAYMNNKSVGIGRVYITGMGNYGGRTSKTFKIVGDVTDLLDSDISSIAEMTYTGKALTPEVVVKDGDTVLTRGTDYQVFYSSNINAGTALVTVEGLGHYAGVAQATFTIKPVELSKAELKLATTNYSYDAKAKKPQVTGTFGELELETNTDFTVAYTNNTKVGTATAKITGCGNYTGTVTKTFTIGPKNTAITKLTAGSKKFTAKWTIASSQTVGGYQIRYSLYKSMKSCKYSTIYKRATVTKTITGLTSGKTYYVSIRTYQKINNKTYYSTWSTAKTVKVK